MAAFLISLVVYIASAIYVYRWNRIAHSEHGIYEYSVPTPGDILSVFIPVVNSVLALNNLLESPSKRSTNRAKKFFRIK